MLASARLGKSVLLKGRSSQSEPLERFFAWLRATTGSQSVGSNTGLLSFQQRKAPGYFIERLNWESWSANVAILRQAAAGDEDGVRLYGLSSAGADSSKLFFTVPRAAPVRGSLTERLAIATGGAGGGDPLLQRQRLRFIFADAGKASAFFALLSHDDTTGDAYEAARSGALTTYRNVSAGGLTSALVSAWRRSPPSSSASCRRRACLALSPARRRPRGRRGRA